MNNFLTSSFIKYCACFIMLICTPIAYATPSSDLAGLLNAVHTMQGSFTQKVYDTKGKVLQTSNGRMAFERPGKFRWQVIKPIPQLIIANDQRLWIYDPDLQQVTIRKMQRATGDTPALLLSHSNTSLDADFAVEELKNKGPGWRWFALKPHKGENMFASVEMGFEGGEIRRMRLQDHLGHITAVEFENAKINTTLAPTLFVFKASSKVDVIDETRKR